MSENLSVKERMEKTRKLQDNQTRRDTVLTTTITSEEFERLLYRLHKAENLAGAVAADWMESTGFSFNKPSDATLEALKHFDHDLYFETEKKVKEAKAENAGGINRAIGRPEKAEPHVYPYISPDSPGVPLREIRIGDYPGSDPQITCETKGE